MHPCFCVSLSFSRALSALCVNKISNQLHFDGCILFLLVDAVPRYTVTLRRKDFLLVFSFILFVHYTLPQFAAYTPTPVSISFPVWLFFNLVQFIYGQIHMSFSSSLYHFSVWAILHVAYCLANDFFVFLSVFVSDPTVQIAPRICCCCLFLRHSCVESRRFTIHGDFEM